MKVDFKNGYTFKIRDFSTFKSSFKEIFVHEDYRLPYSKKTKIIVDVGANIGLFSIYSVIRQPQARIYALEADPLNFSILKENIESNSLKDRIQAFNFAVSSKIGETVFYQSEISGWSSLFKTRGSQDGKPVYIDTINISTFCKNHGIKKIDFLKVDIEGAEYDVFLGDRDIFNVSIREIIVEVDRNPRDEKYKFNDLVNYMKNFYYNVKIIGAGDYSLVHCYRQKL